MALKCGGVYYILANTKGRSGLENYDINYSDILQLSDCGLMRSNLFTFDSELLIEDKGRIVMYNDSIIIYFDVNNKLVKLNIYTFTESGNQLLKVVNTVKKKRQIIKELKTIKNKYNWLEMEAYDVVSSVNDNVEFSKKQFVLSDI